MTGSRDERGYGGKVPKLLVVTPPGPNADELVGKLVDRGFDVTRAPSGSEALPAAQRGNPDVILMDSALSAMDRWHAVKRLNGDPRTSRIPVLTLASDAYSPAGLQRVLDKLDASFPGAGAPTGDGGLDATPVSASSRVAARRVATLPTEPMGAVPPVKRPTPQSPVRDHVPPVRLAQPEATKTPVPSATTSGPVAVVGRDPTAGGRILVVDDNDLNRDMLSRRLARRGYKVEAVEDGERALAAIDAQPFDLVLLDWMMPGLSGLDVLHRIRERFSGIELPVIMATAKTEAEDVVQALQAEANDYVTKPLNFDVVHARIRTQLSLVRAHRELLASERRYRALLENTGDMIVQYDLDGKLRYVSPASRTLLGFEPHELTARSWYDGLHPIDRRELLNQQDQRSLPSNFTYIARMGRKDGTWIWVETSCRVLRDRETGAVQTIQAACRDVTEHIDRIAGDEPPLPLGGDIMAHPGWRASGTGEPAPPREPPPRAGQARSDAPVAPAPPPIAMEAGPLPIVFIGALPGADASLFTGLAPEEIGYRVASALRALAEKSDA